MVLIMSNLIFIIAAAGYLLIGIFYIIDMVFKKIKNDIIPVIILVIIFTLHLIGMVIRTIEAGYTPLSNTYESLIFFSWAIILVGFLIRFKYKIKIMVGIASILAFLSIGGASLLMSKSDKMIRDLMPALQSWWLEIHVITSFIAYAAFAVAFGSSIIYLLKTHFENKKNNLAKKLPDLESTDNLSYNLIALGFAFLTLGILTGAVWAKYAWGQYWGWDPKETWALVTWLVYAIYLHTRRLKNWKGIKSNWLSVIGFITVLFTYFGVNYLLSGLHSYV